MRKYLTKLEDESYRDAMRATRFVRDQSTRNARTEAALFGEVRFEGREKQIDEQETTPLDTA